MKCGTCEYDMGGTLDAARCPECGVVDWRRRRDGWRAGEWWGIGVAAVPLVLAGLMHLLYVGVRLELGRWPVPHFDDPRGMPLLGPACEWVWVGFVLSVPAAIVTVLCMAALMHFYVRRPGMSIFTFVCWAVMVLGVGILMGVWDPVGAMGWWID